MSKKTKAGFAGVIALLLLSFFSAPRAQAIISTCDSCNDGKFCNGRETCAGGLFCQPGIPPCLFHGRCSEAVDACITECTRDEHCSDSLYCSGEERCVAGRCEDSSGPACGQGLICDEFAGECRHDHPGNLLVNPGFEDDFEAWSHGGFEFIAHGIIEAGEEFLWATEGFRFVAEEVEYESSNASVSTYQVSQQIDLRGLPPFAALTVGADYFGAVEVLAGSGRVCARHQLFVVFLDEDGEHLKTVTRQIREAGIDPGPDTAPGVIVNPCTAEVGADIVFDDQRWGITGIPPAAASARFILTAGVRMISDDPAEDMHIRALFGGDDAFLALPEPSGAALPAWALLAIFAIHWRRRASCSAP